MRGRVRKMERKRDGVEQEREKERERENRVCLMGKSIVEA